ncbi:MAG: tetratricopeptide repeat protein [Aggregatilineales bacterium]
MSESSEPRRSLVQRIGLARADAQAYYERGLLAFAAHKYEDALADLDAALQLSPGYAELYSARGLVALEAGKLPEAQEDFEYAIKLNKRQWLAHYGLGVVAFNRKAWGAAIEAFTKAQTIAPGRPEPWYYRAVAQYNAGDADKALADMKIALRWFSAEDKKRGDDAKKWLKALGADDAEIEAALPNSGKSTGSAGKRSETSSPAKPAEHTHEAKGKQAPDSPTAEKGARKE